MSSDDSDDEPLSSLAGFKAKQDSGIEIIPIFPNEKKKSTKPKSKLKKTSELTIELAKVRHVVERPMDVWMYLNDLQRTGPYSCLLCSEWFINKTKIVLHYIVNHKKNFCSVCRYFVIDDEAWIAHQNFHKPWCCSQCSQTFEENVQLNTHLSEDHHLMHCKLCHETVPGDEEYTHLVKKHNTSKVTPIDDLWIFDSTLVKLHCTLCDKTNISVKHLTNHYMSFHHITLNCLTPFLSGKDIDFPVKGADLTQTFIDTQLRPYARFGYVDLSENQEKSNEIEFNIVKQEPRDDYEENNEIGELKPNLNETSDSDKNTDQNQTVSDTHNEIANVEPNKYSGEEDFDITLMELIILQECYYDYVNQSIKEASSNSMPIHSINYETAVANKPIDITCGLCPEKHTQLNTFKSHITKMHCVKLHPIFTCRVCLAPFDTSNELQQHINKELGEFDDLWICQFCDKEFDNREQTRAHLTEHWKVLEYDNCFSPHLGFKCKYCPVLFWNEGDREKHHVNMHFQQNNGDFYKCGICDEAFGDKVWFVHHYTENHCSNLNTVPLYILKCCICGLCLPTVEDMRIHFKLNHPDARKVFCSFGSCQHRPFSHKKSFQLHFKSLHIKVQVPYVDDGRRSCGICGEQFPSARSCASHATQAHRLACSLCHLTLATLDERKIHYLIHHPGRHPFQCDKCDKSFQYKSSLYLHKQDHSSIQQDYTCNLCGKVFKKRDSYREHCAIHTGPRHACSYCPMVFVQRSNMLRHERRHTGERPYTCRYCPRSFADKGACNTHTRTHEKEPSFACTYCGQTFVQKSKLTYHIRKHTGENLETCSECGKQFTSIWSLREHMKIHQKNKDQPIKCPMCEKSFDSDRGMLRHMRRAHVGNGERYKCPICWKVYNTGAGLKEHVVSHSDTKMFKCNLCPKNCSTKRTIIRHVQKRHGIKATDPKCAQSYTKLDPRDCNLNLDVETMNNIFGPPKKPKVAKVLINEVRDTEKEMEDENRESDKDGDTKMDETEDQTMEAINFVCIKIENVDECDMEQ